MSYLNFPRIHFSGTYQANPSTINNTPNNWDPHIYPTPNQLSQVELYWNPKGDGGFSLEDDCVVTQVDYADGTSATTPAEDSIIGQPVKCVYKSSFPLQSALVDLDPMQQNVSEIWAMTLQIGGEDANLTGNVPNVAFNGIWQQCQGPEAPHSSASGSAVFQVKMKEVSQTGNASNSRFLQHYSNNPTGCLSLNINTNAHNNAPPNYLFNSTTFQSMSNAGVPDTVLSKITPMQNLFQLADSSTENGPGYVPTKIFVKYMLQQYLTTDEYNANIDSILSITKQQYTRITPYDFLFGMITGTAGPSNASDPNYFVPSRMLVPTSDSSGFYAPFSIDESGLLTLNLGNSLPTNTPGNDIYHKVLGETWLVAFPNGNISLDNATKIVQISTQGEEFYGTAAGFFMHKLDGDFSQTPLGILSVTASESILMAEDPNGYFMRADQFVYRMNPGFETTTDFPRGRTNTVRIHALKFGIPVPDGTQVSMTMMSESQAIKYTLKTLGTSGTKGVKNLSIPQDALKFPSTASTVNGVATFDMACTDPNNPRHYIDGQVYFLDYNFINNPITKEDNDIVSVMVYDQEVKEDAPTVLAKFGRLYKIMGFLTDEKTIEGIDMRNMIKTLLEKPMNKLVHMPVTRDLSAAARNKVVDWVNALNNS